MNDTKTEILPVIPKSAPVILSGLLVRVGTDEVSAAKLVRKHDVYLDRYLYMAVQVSHTISTCSLHLRNIGLIHHYLTRPIAERVVNVMVTSRLDYCNSLLFGTSANNKCRLQRQPLAWNAQPSSVTCKTSLNSFKSASKTHLFATAYVCFTTKHFTIYYLCVILV